MYIAIIAGRSGDYNFTGGALLRPLTDILVNDNGIVTNLSTTSGQFSLKKGTYRFKLWTLDAVASLETTARNFLLKERISSYLYDEATLTEITGAYASNTFPAPTAAPANNNTTLKYTYYQQQEGVGVFTVLASSVLSIRLRYSPAALSGTTVWGLLVAAGVMQYAFSSGSPDRIVDAQPGTVLELEKIS